MIDKISSRISDPKYIELDKQIFSPRTTWTVDNDLQIISPLLLKTYTRPFNKISVFDHRVYEKIKLNNFVSTLLEAF